jgi:hypothetical protein
MPSDFPAEEEPRDWKTSPAEVLVHQRERLVGLRLAAGRDELRRSRTRVTCFVTVMLAISSFLMTRQQITVAGDKAYEELI